MSVIAEEVLRLLACPCPAHAPVVERDGAVQCQRCSARFPIRDGVPVMLLEHAEPGPSGAVGEV